MPSLFSVQFFVNHIQNKIWKKNASSYEPTVYLKDPGVDISAKKKPNKDNDLNEMLLIPAEKSADNNQSQDIVDSRLKQTFDPQGPR